MTGKLIVDGDQLLDYIDQIKEALRTKSRAQRIETGKEC